MQDSHAPDRDAYGVLAPPPLIFLVGLGAGIALDALLPDAGAPWPLGAALLVGGLGLVAWFGRTFVAERTAILPGKQATALVVKGPYRLSRNPGYLGMAAAAAGIALLAQAPWALLALVPTVLVVDQGVIAREERYLEQRFGDEYRAFRARVRRWL
jgi:protein-S-isoprenylcysteine O-methyltransferase Ste14